MLKKNVSYVIANFGGPRNLSGIRPFLQALLTDQDVVRTKFPKLIHHFLFSRIAKKRALKIAKNYQSIGGKSPIYEDTEAVAHLLRKEISAPILTFHRYLPATHGAFIEEIQKLTCEEVRFFPMFPQFTYATTGSIARWLDKHLPKNIVNKIRWIKSYPTHPAFVQAHQNSIRKYLTEHKIDKKEAVLLFSSHGIPQQFVDTGDVYEDECRASFHAIMKGFPKALGKLAFQSKFGPGEWIKPYTIDVCESILSWHDSKPHVVFIPLSFTSDHIETLFEMEQEYLPVIKRQGLKAYRVPALTLDPQWIHAIHTIIQEDNLCNNHMLIRSRP